MMIGRWILAGFVTAAMIGTGASFAQEPLFKTKIADEAQEEIDAEAARKARAAARAKARAERRAAAAAKRRAAAKPKPAPKPAAPRIVPLTAAERSSVVNRFTKCYRTPRVLTRNAESRVEIVVKLSKEGFLTSSPLLVRTNAELAIAEEAYASARKALFSCQPYVLPVEKYGDWKEVNLILNQNTVELR